jgi:hypothetical protein
MKTNLLLKNLCVGIASIVLTGIGWLALADAGDFRGRTLAVTLHVVADVFRLDLTHPTQMVAIGATLGSIALYFVAGVLVWEFAAKRLGFDQ